jgi:zinc/manganese transport system substrate-binding protein
MRTRMSFSTLCAAVVRRLLILVLVAALAAGLAACGEDDGGADPGRIPVVATTTQAADLARNVGGDRVEVQGLLAPNADPHEYEVRPQDVEAVADANVVVRSGGDVDEWLSEAIAGAGTDAPVVTLSDKVHRIGSDPHWWQDPRNAAIAAGEIRAALDAADPSHAAVYDRNAKRYTRELIRLDGWVASCIGKVPQSERRLVTTHDSLAYYARRYGIDVIGTVIPSLSTAGQPSAGETAELVRTIRATGVKAIFAESSVSPKVEEAIARETGATVGKPLWADSLGPRGSGGATYVQSLMWNTSAIVDGLTGGAVTCPVPIA